MVNSSDKQSVEQGESNIDKKRESLFKGFSRLTMAERFSRLIEMGA